MNKAKFKVGEVLITHSSAGSKLVAGNPVVVVDEDRYPKSKAELVKKIGYNNIDLFVCVENPHNKEVGFYMCARFRRPAKKVSA